MATFYWHPSEPLFNSASAIRRQLDDVFFQEDTAADKGSSTDSKGDARLGRYWLPLYELIDTPESFLVKVQLPGVAVEDIEIEATHQAVTISGRQVVEPLGDRHKVLYSGFPQCEFCRVIEFPLEINCEKIKADFHNGLLSLELPKSGRYRPVKVQVQAKPRLGTGDQVRGDQQRLVTGLVTGSEADTVSEAAAAS